MSHYERLSAMRCPSATQRSPRYGNQAVGVALFSYAGGLYWGLNADWDGMPDLHGLVETLHEEFERLLRLAVSAPAA